MAAHATTRSGLTAPMFWLGGLSLSIGWGIRGNFGHEYGAMMAGTLGAMAVVLMSGREDWWRRIAYFAFFGGIGWGFGGSMSYGHVLGYTHSGDSLSIAYGFASLFVIGFLWAAIGGAGTALPAFADRERLTEFFTPFIVICLAWWLQDIVVDWLLPVLSDYRQESLLYWYDSDWLSALIALIALLGLAAIRRRICRASALMLHMAVGWWVGFLVLTVLLGLRMTPPRGDNWAGCVGMTAGLLVYLLRNGLAPVATASVVAGFIGGFGFATATLFEILEVMTGYQTNWHSVLEQTYGFINGAGIAIAMGLLVHRAPRLTEDPPVRRWADPFAICFVLLMVTYLNISKNPEEWVKAKVMPGVMYGIPTAGLLNPATGFLGWFDVAYLAVAAVIIGLCILHLRRPLALLPSSLLGRSQLFYLLFLWWMTIGNFERALVGFQPQRLVTEWVICLNAALCTFLVCYWGGRTRPAPEEPVPAPVYIPLLKKATVIGLVATVLSIGIQWGVTWAAYGAAGCPFRGKPQIRFGPNATATTEKPIPGQVHP